MNPYVAIENGRRVLHWPPIAGETTIITRQLLTEMVEQLNEADALRKATGGLPPELVAKALQDIQARLDYPHGDTDWYTPDEFKALRAATFEVPA